MPRGPEAEPRHAGQSGSWASLVGLTAVLLFESPARRSRARRLAGVAIVGGENPRSGNIGSPLSSTIVTGKNAPRFGSQ